MAGDYRDDHRDDHCGDHCTDLSGDYADSRAVPRGYRSVLASLEREATDAETPPERLEELAGEPCVQRLVAENPATPAAALWRLRRAPNRAVRAAVAGNANAPFELLHALVADYPVEVLENPVWPWLLLEQPGLAEKLTGDLAPEVIGGMLRCAALPLALLNPLTRSPHEGVCHLAERHVALVADATAPIRAPAPDEIAHVRAAFHSAIHTLSMEGAEPLFALRGLVGVDFLEMLLDTPFVELLACCPDAPARLLTRLPLTNKGRVPQLLAAHRHARPELLDQLFDYSDLRIKVALAGNPRAPASVLRWLALDDSADVRWRVAASLQADEQTLRRLARDPEWDVRMVVARNPNTPPADLRSLANDPQAQVRITAERTAGPERLARYVRTIDDPLVRRAVAAHPDATHGLLELLAADGRPDVRVQVARHPRAGERLIAQLAADSEPAVRAAAAEHPRLSVSLRRALEVDDVLEVRQHLARNPSTPFMTLRRLWTSANPDQRRIIARHPAITPERRAQFTPASSRHTCAA